MFVLAAVIVGRLSVVLVQARTIVEISRYSEYEVPRGSMASRTGLDWDHRNYRDEINCEE